MMKSPLSAAQEVLKSEERLRLLIDAVRDYAIFLLDPSGVVSSWNTGAQRLKGYRASEIIGRHFSTFYPAEDVAAGKPERELAEAIREGRVEDEGWRVRKDGSRFWANVVITALFDEAGNLQGFGKVTRDLTERKLGEELLRQSAAELEQRVAARTAELQAAHDRLNASLTEKETLLREIHHRVKNNLQIVSSLLSLQMDAMTDPRFVQLLQDSQYRIRAMALVHEKLYGSSHLARVDMHTYARSLVEKLVASMGKTVELNIDAAGVWLSIDTAIPCGLILNELIVNAIKHAFPGTGTGRVSVRFEREGRDRFLMTVSDNGVGLPDSFDLANAPSLGMRLIHALVEQLHGTIMLERNGGTKFRITFQV